MKAILLRSAVYLLFLLMAVQVFRVGRDSADAVLDRLGGWSVSMDMRSDRAGLAKLYWDTGLGYGEADSASVPVEGGGRWRRLVFRVPQEPLRAVRFDPLRSEGRIEIRDVHLTSGSGRSLFELDMAKIRAGAQVATMTREGEILSVLFATDAVDPGLRFGAIVPEGVVGPVAFPWLGYTGIGALLAALFLMRRHASGPVRAINAIRAPIAALTAGLAVIDRPGKTTLAIGALSVLALQLFLLYPLHEVIDLPIWDEAGTMGGGVGFLHGEGLGSLPNAPLSRLLYAGLVSIFGPAGSIAANQYIVRTVLVLVLFLFSTRVAGSVMVGLVISGVWALGSFQLEYPILTYPFALAWFALGVLTVERNPPLGLALIVLAALVRLEYQFAVPVAAIGLLLSVLMRGGRVLRVGKLGWGMVVVASCLVFTVFANLSSWNSGAGRGWFAVKQHYALRLDQEGAFPGNNPFLEFDLVTDRDFPEAASLGAALRMNPKALADHVLWNLRHVPAAYLELFTPTGAGRVPWRLALMVFGLVGLPGLIVAVCSPVHTAGRLKTLVRRFPLTISVTLSGLLVVVPGVIVFAKPAYLLPIVPLGLALVALLHSLGTKNETTNRLCILAALLVIGAAVVTGVRPYLDHSGTLPVRATLAIVDEALPEDRTAVLVGLSASAYAAYLGWERVIPVEPFGSAGGGDVLIERARFSSLIAAHDPDLIMINADWRRSAYYDVEGETRLAELGWVESPIPGGSLWKRQRDAHGRP